MNELAADLTREAKRLRVPKAATEKQYDLDLRVDFGRPHPTRAMKRQAQRALDALSCSLAGPLAAEVKTLGWASAPE